jgi:hypothetical protein
VLSQRGDKVGGKVRTLVRQKCILSFVGGAALRRDARIWLSKYRRSGGRSVFAESEEREDPTR